MQVFTRPGRYMQAIGANEEAARLTGVPVATLFGFSLRSLESFLAVSLACLALVTLAIYLLVRTSFGRNLKAIRDNEVAAAAFGKN